VAAAILDLFEP